MGKTETEWCKARKAFGTHHNRSQNRREYRLCSYLLPSSPLRMSSSIRTLRSLVRIPLKTWIWVSPSLCYPAVMIVWSPSVVLRVDQSEAPNGAVTPGKRNVGVDGPRHVVTIAITFGVYSEYGSSRSLTYKYCISGHYPSSCFI
jgi:hypothetical protein